MGGGNEAITADIYGYDPEMPGRFPDPPFKYPVNGFLLG